MFEMRTLSFGSWRLQKCNHLWDQAKSPIPYVHLCVSSCFCNVFFHVKLCYEYNLYASKEPLQLSVLGDSVSSSSFLDSSRLFQLIPSAPGFDGPLGHVGPAERTPAPAQRPYIIEMKHSYTLPM